VCKHLDKVGGMIHTQATALGDRTDTDVTMSIQLAIKTTKKTTTSTTGTGTGDKQLKKKKSVSVFGQDDDDDDEDELPQGPPVAAFALVVPSRPSSFTNNKSSMSTSASSSVPPLKKRPRPADASTKDNPKTQRLKESTDTSSHHHDQPSPWLYRAILVRIVHKTASNGTYFKRKAVVDELVNDTTARVTVLDSGPDIRDG
jgi:hypothetical protein